MLIGLVGCATLGLGSGVLATLAQHAHRGMLPPASPVIAPKPLPPSLQPVLPFTGHAATVRGLSWSPDGTRLASGDNDALLQLWRPDGTIERGVLHSGPVLSVAWSPDGHRLVTAAANQVRFLDAQTGHALAPLRVAHTAPVTSVSWSTAAGQLVISASEDQRALVWNTQTFQPQAAFTRHTTPLEAVATLSGTPIVASASRGGVVRLWQVDTLEEVHAFYQDALLPMRTLAFRPTGGTALAVGGEDGTVRVWTNALVCQRMVGTPGGQRCAEQPERLHAHPWAVRTVAWSPNGGFLATGGDDGTLAIWDAAGNFTQLLAMPQSAPVLALAWSPDGRQLASAAGMQVTIWAFRA